MLKIQDVSCSYGAVPALEKISMTMTDNQITCIMGRNGVGKTTLMKAIMGLLALRGGSVMMGDQELAKLPAYRRARLGLGLVPQGRQIFAKLTVYENLRVGLEARVDGAKKIPDLVYELFPVLKTMAGRMGGDLSGGQQQQLAIARALVGQPSVLLLDEPTEGIQPNIIQQIGDVLHRLVTEMGMTVVLVEQCLSFVREFGHAFYIMNRGQVAVEGTTDQLDGEIVGQYLSV